MNRARNRTVFLITGMTGSGKSSYARYLLKNTPRAVVLDRMLEYSDGAIARDFDSALDFLINNATSNFRLICRFDRDEEYDGMMEAVVVLQKYMAERYGEARPISLFVEEVSYYTTSLSVNENLRQLYAYGRHYRVNLIGVVHSDVDTHRSIRTNSDVLIAFRQRKLSADMKTYFPDLEAVANLETYGNLPEHLDSAPIVGVHCLSYPPEENPTALWLSANQALTPEP